jgi:predicted kinase
MQKRLIIVCSPPASGKTYVSMELAKRLKHVVYLDKDALVPLSNVVFEVANQPLDRESPFFEKYIRNTEYDVILDMAYQALLYDDIILVNAPFTREIHDEAYMLALKDKLAKQYMASLTIVWVKTSVEVVHQRMIERNSPRDVFKLKDWDAYIKGIDYNVPSYLIAPKNPQGVFDFFVFRNDSQEQFETSMAALLKFIEETEKAKELGNFIGS